MEKEVQKNIISILEKSYEAILKRDIKLLRDLSNHTIHTASTVQDENSISIAVIIYSFSKIFERNYNEYKDWDKFYVAVKLNLRDAINSLKKNDYKNYEKYMKNILSSIDKLDKKLRDYIKEVMEEAKVSKASRIHEHGISLAKTAELLGVNEWELMDYTGKTGISDIPLAKTISVRERMKCARRIFK